MPSFFRRTVTFFLIAVCVENSIQNKALAELKQKTIWVKSINMPFVHFNAHIKSLESSSLSYAEYERLKAQKAADAFKLKEKLLYAQELYLSGKDILALRAFKSITDLALMADWDKEQRRIIIYSFLRQAQSKLDPEKKHALLLSTVAFAVFPLDEKTYPDYSLFPPPLMITLKKLQDKQNTLDFKVQSVFPQHELVLINGIPISRVKIPQGLYRVSAFSSSHRPWSKLVNMSNLVYQKIQTQSLSYGLCGSPKLRLKEQFIKILPFNNCPKTLTVLNEDPSQKFHSILDPNINKMYNGISMQHFSVNQKKLSDSKKNFKKQTILPLVVSAIAGVGILLWIGSLQSNSDKSVSFNNSSQLNKGKYVY